MSIKQKIVLIVDDDDDIRKLLDKILAENPPHVIVSDLHMEPEDGFSFIESVRSNKQLSLITSSTPSRTCRVRRLARLCADLS